MTADSNKKHVKISETDIYLFNEGRHFELYGRFGCHLGKIDEKAGAFFSVWAPNAENISVIGDFNGWEKMRNSLQLLGNSGIWHGFVPGAGQGQKYKFAIQSKFNNFQVEKADPFAFYAEVRPRTASIIWDLSYKWGDEKWMGERKAKNAPSSPLSIYEVHLGSYARKVEEQNRFLTYRELADILPAYVTKLGFTHVEFMPITEFPFDGSWGYQVTGYFAPTSRYGTPQDFMYLVDRLHQANIGVILDWVPSHFPSDGHGLSYFDGTHLYEHADWRQGYHPDWKSLIYNYGRNEVRSFLISSALFWFDQYHIDSLRVDAVASMLYLDYSRKEGEWVPNKYGGRENLEAIEFIRQLNEAVYQKYPDITMIAEESTAWSQVSRPTYLGGLGFGLKWDMGWMHDTLKYMTIDPIHRKFHQGLLTFRMIYAFHENFILSLSHDEIVHGKGSLATKMPGDAWQKFANLRLLFSYMFAQPGKKLMFMGDEFGQWQEWNHEQSLDWHLLEHPLHAKLQLFVSYLNKIYRSERALYEVEFEGQGFEWLDLSDHDNSVLSFYRKSKDQKEIILCVFNFTPVPRYNYRLGVPNLALWSEILNSDAQDFHGSGHGNFGQIMAVPIPSHNQLFSLNLTLPPLGALFLKLNS